MADQTISSLNTLTGAALSSNDELPIVDVSAGETKKITASDIIQFGIGLIPTGSIDISRLDQNSTTKLGSTAIADDAITADKFADNSSIAAQAATPSTSNFSGRGWYNSSTSNFQVYSAGAYRQVVMPAAGIASGAITTAKIAANAITDSLIQASGLSASSIATGAVTTVKIADSGVTTAKIQNASITNDKIALSTIQGSRIASGTITATLLADSSIVASKISAGAIVSSGISDGAVTNAKIADSTIAYAKLNLSAGDIPGDRITSSTISSLQIVTGGVLTANIADSAVTTTKIADAGITASKIGSGAVVTAGIQNGAVTNDKIANTTIAYGKLNLSNGDIPGNKITTATISGLQIASGGVLTANIADSAVTYSKLNLNNGDIPGAKITSATISGLQIATGGVLTANIADSAVTNAKIANGTIGAGKFAASVIATADIQDDAITQAKIADAAVGALQIASSGVTAIKLADNSSTVVSSADPVAAGTFVGQSWLNTTNKYEYIWDGSQWIRQAALSSISFTDSTPLAFSVAFPDAYSAVVTSTLDNQAANTVLVGPASGVNATPTFRALVSDDLPIATAVDPGAVAPGAGLVVNGTGVLSHSNAATAGTYAGAITIDAQGHIVSANASLTADQIPALDASKIATGTFSSDFLAANSVTAEQLADYGIAQVSETAPTPEFAGQWWINPSDRSAYIWVGTVSPVPNGYWLLVGYGSPTQLNLRFGGTYNATTNTVVTLNEYGVEAGLTIGQALTAPNSQNNGIYLVATTGGTGTTPAPATTLAVGDWVLSQGTGANWTKVAIVSGASGTFNDYDILCDGTYFTPDMAAVSDVRDALVLLWGRTQIATTSQVGVVRESSEVLVNDSTGEMTLGIVDEGTY